MGAAMKISMKERQGKTWGPVHGMAGLTLRAMLASASGREIVAELELGESVHYLCGNEEWRTKMAKAKGRAMTFDDGLKLLGEIAPELLEEIPISPMVAAVFGDVSFVQTELKGGSDAVLS